MGERAAKENDVLESHQVANRYALLVGVGEYDHTYGLQGVYKDIENFKGILEDPEFSEFQVGELVDATFLEARKAISEISRTAKENDIIFFYFAGNAKYDHASNRYYLLFKDSDPEYLDATCLESEYILSQFRKSECKTFVIIIDACYSGAFFNNNRGLPHSLVALASCDVDERALETFSGGVFSSLLVRGFKSDFVDANRDGKITFSELFDYMIEEMKKDKRFSNNTPKKWEWNIDRDLHFLSSPRPVFISYKRKQKKFVTRLSKALNEQDIPTFVDQEKLRIGDDWMGELERSIKNARAFLFIMDNEILHSKVSTEEIAIAHKHNVPIFPIQVEEDLRVHAMFEAEYGKYNRLFFDHDEFDETVATIVAHIKAIRITSDDGKKDKIVKAAAAASKNGTTEGGSR